VILVVKLTGDSVADYVSNSMVKAANAKGGTGKIFLAPLHLFTMATHAVRGHRWIVPWLAVIVAAGAVIQYYWKDRFRYLVPLQVATGAIVLAVSSPYHKQELLQMVSFMSLVSVLASYLILPIIIVRLVISRMRDGKAEWDPREILLLIPVAELASFSTSNAGTTVSFLSPIALLLLLVPVLQPFRRQASWLNPSFVSIVAMMGLVAAADKIDDPYTWLLFHSSPMFENRQWYRHPVYGPMYIDRDLLHFIEPICQQVDQSSPRPELLSMPFSYPNYFCDTPPWHGYVQTFFDTSTPSTIERLEKELQTSPPEWIVYQRQIKVMREQELTYHKGQPLAHRDLDTMIMRKIASGQWKLVEKSNYLLTNYLPKEKLPYQDGDGWYVIRTRP
jgi:hypothetical protein